MMNKLSPRRLILSVLLVVSVLFVRASVSITGPDSIRHTGTLAGVKADSSLIGPEVNIPDNSAINNVNEVLPFCDVLCSFMVPFQGRVISRYGMRHGRMHTGTDIKLSLGDTVRAVYEGVVSRASRYYGYGNLVVLNHIHGLQTYYAHFSKILVKEGDHIKPGEPVGLGGRTGRATTEHLHFEVRENGKAYNPELVYDFENIKIRENVYGKAALAELITNPKTGEKIRITTQGNSYVNEMSTSAMFNYVIKAGDSLWKIAKKFNTSVGVLCEHNNLSTRSVLKVGSVVKIQK